VTDLSTYQQDATTGARAAGSGENAYKLGRLWADNATRTVALRDLLDDLAIQKRLKNQAVPDITPLQEAMDVWTTTVNRGLALHKTILDLVSKRDTVGMGKRCLKEAEVELKSKMGKICLLCGSQLKTQ
jgi:hypothetical protein